MYLLELRLFIPSISKIPPNNIEVGHKSSAEFRFSIVVVCYDPSHSGSPTLLGVAIISSIGGLWKQMLGATDFGEADPSHRAEL